jgi:hypothetical protein
LLAEFVHFINDFIRDGAQNEAVTLHSAKTGKIEGFAEHNPHPVHHRKLTTQGHDLFGVNHCRRNDRDVRLEVAMLRDAARSAAGDAAAQPAELMRRVASALPEEIEARIDAAAMERELTLLRQKAGSVSPRDLEPLMAAAGGALPDGRVPSAVEFAPGELHLRGVTLAPDEESVFNTRLQAVGYRARIEDGTLLVRSEGTP